MQPFAQHFPHLMSPNPTILPSGILSPPVANSRAVDERDFFEIEEMAEGAYCRLLKARRQGQWWVLKCLKKEYVGQAFYEGLLQKEYDVLTRLSHPCVVKAVGLEPVEGLGECLVMEYVQGLTLDAFVGSCAERRRLAEQMVEAVAWVHAHQVVHRDLKPQNILVTDNGHNLKIIDFGLADADNYAVLKQAAGTPAYVSPEQQKGGSPDVRNDIYSLGVILRELRLGAMYAPVVRRCTAKLTRRYNGAQELREALARVDRRRRWLTLAGGIILGIIAVVAVHVDNGQQTTDGDQNDTVKSRPAAVKAPSNLPQGGEDPTVTKAVPAANFYAEEKERGCRRIDKLMAEMGYAAFLDTLRGETAQPLSPRRKRDLTQQSTHFYLRGMKEVQAMQKEWDGKLTEQESMALYIALGDYINNQYTNVLTETLSGNDRRE